MMIRRYVLPLVSLGLLIFAIWFVVKSRPGDPVVAPPAEPPRSPYAQSVAGAALVEACTENIAMGSPAAGIVFEVFVRVGDQVKTGDALFHIDDRQLQAELEVREAAVAVAQAELDRLEEQPRREQLPVSEALVSKAAAMLAEKTDYLQRVKDLLAKQAVTEEEYVNAQQERKLAEAELAHSRAELDLLKAGAWQFDKERAQAAVVRVAAERDQTRTDLERLTVRALVDGEVLQVNVRPGEFVTTFAAQPLILLGNTRKLHARVDIDENDIPRLRPGAPAVAMLKGRSDVTYPLTFVRVEPFVIPKRSLTGENVERVDTRVLQVIYTIDTRGKTLYVGQQLDVFIDASDRPVEEQRPAVSSTTTRRPGS
jgi:multidrug resistance efflux pump